MSISRQDPPDLSGPAHNLRPRSPSELLEPARAPAPPRGRRIRRERRRLSGFVRLVSGVMTMLLIVLGIIGGGAVYFNHQFGQPGPLDVSRTIAIPRGEGRIQIATRLESEGIIANRWTFLINHMFKSYFGDKRIDMKAGEYEIKKRASMREVLDKLISGKAVLYSFSAPEGLTSQQIVGRLNADPNLTGEIKNIPPEGSLLPDTYRFSKGMDRQELLDRMQSEARRAMERLWSERQANLPVKTPEEAIILASIVEKETGKTDERKQVASVFVNRMRKGMRLQSDPTIIYGIVGGKGSLGRPIYRADINKETAYNTYRIKGLPPTPICNPGRLALQAVLQPADTKYFYFVADGTGGHKFSETLKQHNEGVANWRKIERKARAAKKAAVKAKPADAKAADGKALPVESQKPGTAPAKQKTKASIKVIGGTVAAAAASSGALKLLNDKSAAGKPKAPAAKKAATAKPDATPKKAVPAKVVNVPLPERKTAR